MSEINLTIAAYDTQGLIEGEVRAKRLDYKEDEAKEFADFLLKHGYLEIKIIPLYAAKAASADTKQN